MVNFLELTKSKLRQKLLVYFFTNPKSNFYLRETAAKLDEDPGNLSKEFAHLEKEGVFTVEERGRQKFFSLNKNYPLYKELESIIFKTVGIEGSLRKVLTAISHVNLAFIFGSFAQKRPTGLSDIDLMIIGTPDEDLLVFKISQLENRLDREINYHIFSFDDWKKKIKEKDSFIENIISGKKIFLIGEENGLSKIY